MNPYRKADAVHYGLQENDPRIEHWYWAIEAAENPQEIIKVIREIWQHGYTAGKQNEQKNESLPPGGCTALPLEMMSMVPYTED